MADEVYRGSQSLLEVQGEETQETREQELVATLSVEGNEQEEQQEQELVALLTVEEARLTEEEEQQLVALLDVEEPTRDVDEEPEIIAILDVVDEVPPIPVAPPQGFQAELGLIYLYNPDAANALIRELNITINEVNQAVEDVTQLTVDALKIKPYSLIGEPIAQYTPCTFDGCIYVALNTMAVKNPTFDPTQWAKIGTADYTKLYNKPNFITRADLSCTVPGLTYNAETGVLSQTNGYVIPTTSRMSTIESGIATNAANLLVETRERIYAIEAANTRIDNVVLDLNGEIIDRTHADDVINGTISTLSGSLNSHVTNTNNPHNVTKAQIGLGNVNNTADLDKPISTLTQQALDALSGRIVNITTDLSNYRTSAAQDLIDAQIRVEIGNVDHNVTLEAMARVQADAALNERIEDIEEVIPSAASTSNLLADRDFVNSSINNMAAHYITASASGNAFGDHARLVQGPWYFQGAEVNPTINDYALVIADETHSGETARYVYDGAQWAFQWTINNTQFTQDQINAINSHITYELVQEYSVHVADFNNPHNVTKDQVGLGNVDNTADLQKPISNATQAALNAKQNTISDLASIRSGAALGATAVQPSALSAYETVAHAAATYQVIGDYVLTSTMNTALAGKQDNLIAGTNITIQNNVISAAPTTSLPWGAMTGDINDQQDLKNALNGKQNELVAGENITIVDNVISATGGSSITVDQTYDPTSTNPQSGTAVAGAIGNATIIFKQGGTVKGTITTNQSQNAEINFDAGGSIVDIDNNTITLNGIGALQAVATINQNTGIVKHWTGTKAQYEALNSYSNDTVYEVIDDYSNITPFAKEVAERNIGELVYSTVPVTDAGLHLADGDLLDGTGIYADFYNYMVGVYNAGHTSIFCSEADWQTEVASRGVCVKYVLDTGNLTIRLPKLKNKLLSDNAVVGNGITLGLTDGTNNIGAQSAGSGGYLTGSATSYGTNAGSTYNNITNLQKTIGITTDVTKSGIEVASSVDVYYYVVIANTTKTPIEVDIDNIATDLNNKVSKGHEVIEFQAPTAQNNYTWYRKYADGWVEQGGQHTLTSNSYNTVNLVVTMANNNYFVSATYKDVAASDTSIRGINTGNYTTTSFMTKVGVNGANYLVVWEVKGMAA